MMLRLLLLAILLAIGLAVFAGLVDRTLSAKTRNMETDVSRGLTDASGIEFLSGIEEGIELSEQEGKPLLIFFTIPNCIYCQKMEEDAFSDEVVAALSKRFVCVRIQREKQVAACDEFEINVYPTLQFMSPQGARLQQLIGQKRASEVVHNMEVALQTFIVKDSVRQWWSPNRAVSNDISQWRELDRRWPPADARGVRKGKLLQSDV